jgi:eukaryotic-like serine/threonine-protein kinase
MDLTIGAKIGQGGFSDVYEATDRLGRKLVVKIIRTSAAMVSNALNHAQALARVQHPNVVSIIALEKVQDPESGQLVEGIVMEHLSGESLSARLQRSKFSSAEVSAVTRGLIAGLRHIHSRGLTHGDLHSENVMVDNEVAKIIDILYRDSLALLSKRIKGDVAP